MDDNRPKGGGYIMFGVAYTPDPPAKKNRDKKKHYKPGKKHKKVLHKGMKAKQKQDLIMADDFDNLPLPRTPKSDIWNYN